MAPTGRIPADTFSNRLLLARKLAGMTIREAAAQTGLNYGSWSNWENGKRPLDILDVCRKIADGLDVDFNWLLLGGQLAGPHGMPTRPGRDTVRYRRVTDRPMSVRPDGRPRTGSPPNGPRRPVRISSPAAA
jgi:transcriptional regulator with XRE-family HTH domain